MTFTLSRTTRLLIEPGRDSDQNEGPGNNHAGWPTPIGLSAWYEVDVEVEAAPDPETGYIIGIDVIDRAVRAAATPLLRAALLGDSRIGIGTLVAQIKDRTAEQLSQHPQTLRLRLSPRHEVAWRSNSRTLQKSTPMTSSQDTLLLREDFEFAASHRLHCPDQSDEWNQKTFGKCNNAQGHGHNYRVQVVAETTMDSHGMPELGFERLETIVKEQVLNRFDHKHLNDQCREFETLNPSVENIARVCRDLLAGPIGEAGGTFDSVTVWETEKTSCTCRR
ncbi:MAG: hypothetical protein CBC35_05570 [Planctomycetes bacterium TMED75]|nr:MAG: hypothetical protein CBC35_05570 [Planctomycetes bacterium TMED75]